jgi:hypothetical protein
MSDAIVPTDPTTLDDLIDAFPDTPDGYSHAVGVDKIRIARRVFNTPGLDTHGNPIPPNVYYDTVLETTATSIEAVLVDTDGTRAWTRYLDAEDRTQVLCASHDKVTGTRAESGEVIACATCPERLWRPMPNGKRGVNCHEVWEVFGVDLKAHTPFIITFKRTSEPAWIAHLNKHHMLKIPASKGRPARNQPLWSYRVRLSLKLSDNKKYATPVIEMLAPMTVSEARECMEIIGSLRSAMAGGAVEVAEDTSFNPDEFRS